MYAHLNPCTDAHLPSHTDRKFFLTQANCSIAGNIVIRILQYRAAGGGYIQLTFLNTIGGIDSVLLSASQANVSS